jgi:hypothetical protein
LIARSIGIEGYRDSTSAENKKFSFGKVILLSLRTSVLESLIYEGIKYKSGKSKSCRCLEVEYVGEDILLTIGRPVTDFL